MNCRSQVCETLAGTSVRVAKVSQSALNLASGHYFDRAESQSARITWEMVGHQGIAPCIPVWKVLADGLSFAKTSSSPKSLGFQAIFRNPVSMTMC